MRTILIISVVLAFALPAPKASALTVENISVSETGGVTVSGEASASGSSAADAEVTSIIRSEGSNTNVRIDIRTSTDDEKRATSVSRTINAGERVEVRLGESAGGSGAEVTVANETIADTGTTSAGTAAVIERFSAFLERLIKLVFFFW